MEIFESIKGEIATLIIGVLTAILSYIGHQIKVIYQEKIKDDQVRSIVKTAVTAIEQLYFGKEVSHEEKKAIVMEKIKEMLNLKKLNVSDLELYLLVEEQVHCCNKGGNI